MNGARRREELRDADRGVILDDAGGEDVEEDLGLRDRLVTVGGAGTQGPRRARLVLDADLHDRQVLPAEARAAVGLGDGKALSEPQPMSRLINWALTDLMLAPLHGGRPSVRSL